MATKVKAPTLASIKGAFSQAFVQMGEGGVAVAGVAAQLKAHTAALLAFDNGIEAVRDTVADMVSAFVTANPRPERRAEFKTRRADPVCAAWDDAMKLRFQNPVVRVNLALEEAKVAQAVRCSNEGTVKLEAVVVKSKDATVEGVKKLLAKVPYSAAAEQAMGEILNAWIAAGKAKIAAPAAQPDMFASLSAEQRAAIAAILKPAA